jgi:hypothetical protein
MPHTPPRSTLNYHAGLTDAEISLGEGNTSPHVLAAVDHLISVLQRETGGAQGRLSLVFSKPEAPHYEAPRAPVYSGSDPTDQISAAPRGKQALIWE